MEYGSYKNIKRLTIKTEVWKLYDDMENVSQVLIDEFYIQSHV